MRMRRRVRLHVPPPSTSFSCLTDSSPFIAAQLSRHERRLLALSSQIASLEAENVGAKNWATKGEAKSKDRPINSLLEEDLEYERSGKVVPIITEETTKTIEELIKKRILDVSSPATHCLTPTLTVDSIPESI